MVVKAFEKHSSVLLRPHDSTFKSYVGRRVGESISRLFESDELMVAAIKSNNTKSMGGLALDSGDS